MAEQHQSLNKGDVSGEKCNTIMLAQARTISRSEYHRRPPSSPPPPENRRQMASGCRGLLCVCYCYGRIIDAICSMDSGSSQSASDWKVERTRATSSSTKATRFMETRKMPAECSPPSEATERTSELPHRGAELRGK